MSRFGKRYNDWRGQGVLHLDADMQPLELPPEHHTDDDWDAYLYHEIHPEDIDIMLCLLMPKFIERDGQVFRADQFTEDGYQTWKYLGFIDSQKMINHLHFEDAFYHDTEDRILQRIANAMQKTWRLCLQQQFPDKAFEVQWHDDGGGPVITFWAKP